MLECSVPIMVPATDLYTFVHTHRTVHFKMGAFYDDLSHVLIKLIKIKIQQDTSCHLSGDGGQNNGEKEAVTRGRGVCWQAVAGQFGNHNQNLKHACLFA